MLCTFFLTSNFYFLSTPYFEGASSRTRKKHFSMVFCARHLGWIPPEMLCFLTEGVIILSPYYAGYDDDLYTDPEIVRIPAHLSRKVL